MIKNPDKKSPINLAINHNLSTISSYILNIHGQSGRYPAKNERFLAGE
jgi:hypothetical protein